VPLGVPEDPNERAFWELTQVIPVGGGRVKRWGRGPGTAREKGGANLEEHTEASEAAAGAKAGEKES